MKDFIERLRNVTCGEISCDDCNDDRERAAELIHALNLECDLIAQTFGKALGYPWFKDDQKNFPGATENDGVCIGEHVPVTIAAEASLYINKLREENEALMRIIGTGGLSDAAKFQKACRMKVTEITTDISKSVLGTYGAFIIHNIGESVPIAVRLEPHLDGTSAELRMLQIVSLWYPSSIIYHDVEQIHANSILKDRRFKKALFSGTQFAYMKDDSRWHKLCHWASRIAAGCYGTRHPMRDEIVRTERRFELRLNHVLEKFKA